MGFAPRFALRLAVTGVLTCCGALTGMPAQAFEPQLGSKNFTPPNFVPNYFSNEGAPFGRGSQSAQPDADRFNTAPVAAGDGYAVRSESSVNTAASAGRTAYRGRQARGRTGRLKSASSRTVRAHGGPVSGRAASRHPSVKTASRRSAATTGRAIAGRSGHAARGAGHVRQASR